jgi:hypothetical protein
MSFVAAPRSTRCFAECHETHYTHCTTIPAAAVAVAIVYMLSPFWFLVTTVLAVAMMLVCWRICWKLMRWLVAVHDECVEWYFWRVALSSRRQRLSVGYAYTCMGAVMWALRNQLPCRTPRSFLGVRTLAMLVPSSPVRSTLWPSSTYCMPAIHRTQAEESCCSIFVRIAAVAFLEGARQPAWLRTHQKFWPPPHFFGNVQNFLLCHLPLGYKDQVIIVKSGFLLCLWWQWQCWHGALAS